MRQIPSDLLGQEDFQNLARFFQHDDERMLTRNSQRRARHLPLSSPSESLEYPELRGVVRDSSAQRKAPPELRERFFENIRAAN